MHHPKVCLDLSVLAKKDTPSHVYIQKFNEIKDQYSYCTPIYTDGSKDNDRVGCGLIINNLSIKQRLPSNASIFTAEVTAIDLALDNGKWQEHWSSCRDNKLFQIKPTLSEWPPGFRRSRKEEVVLSRLRIGHTYFSHSYIYVGKILLNAQHVRRSTLSGTF